MLRNLIVVGVVVILMAGFALAYNFLTPPRVPPVKGYLEGQEIEFIHTEASDPKVAKLLTDMKASPVFAARDFPGVNFIVPHFGAGYFRETLLLAAHCPNVYLDTSSANGWLRYLPYPLDLKLVLQRALDAVGPDRIIFGTDSSWFPRGFRRNILEEQLGILQALGIAKADIQRIMGENIARLLQLT